MVDLPIIFSAPMVRALLDGRKTQTRRLAWRKETWAPELASERQEDFELRGWDCRKLADGWQIRQPSPWQKVQPGDRLYVRESITRSGALVAYMAGGVSLHIWRDEWKQDPRPSIHMPRWASRLTLIVEAVKVESLQGISEGDAKAEGAERMTMDDESRFYLDNHLGTYQCGFAGIWAHLHGTDSWDGNPEIVALTFRVIRENIDRMKEVA